MNQCRFPLRKDLAGGRSDRVYQGNIIQISVVGDRADIPCDSDRRQNGDRLPDTRQDGLSSAPLDIIHIVVGIADDRLEIYHILGHVQFFHKDGAHIVQPVTFIVIDCHIHETLRADG